MTEKWVYQFAKPKTDGNASMSRLLGGKGANLAEMAQINMPIPPGFTITTNACNHYYQNNRKINSDIKQQVKEAIDQLNDGKGFNTNKDNPLIISVRSGAEQSMPGMMDTILNLGINDKNVLELAKKTNDKRFAFDSYRRLIQMYASVVLKINADTFETALENYKQNNNYTLDTDLSADDWQNITRQFQDIVVQETQHNFPQDPIQQLWGAIKAVFDSWKNQRAITYRSLYKIPEDAGTAVNIQKMVFGNLGNNSLTGVCFTRNPNNGKKDLYGEYLVNAQGEDVVAGIRTPLNITKNFGGKNRYKDSMQENMPDIYHQLTEIIRKLENHYKDMQDIEFTVEEGKLYILQTRSGKRTTQAALRIAKDMCQEKIISIEKAITSFSPTSLKQMLHPRIKPGVDKNVIAKALPASPGAACGRIVFNADEAVRKSAEGKKVILVRSETSPEDIHGMYAAQGILTARGGMTSHAAVVARGMGKPCIVGCSNMRINIENKIASFNNHNLITNLGKDDFITIDGTTGEVIKGDMPTIAPEPDKTFKWFVQQADKIRTIKIRANAETIADTESAAEFGAEGIGLCRTEHMFFAEERIIAMRQMIFAENLEERNKALEILLPMQKQDFIEIFQIMKAKPVTIRLLDPPLHEFLPQKKSEIEKLALITGKSIDKIEEQIEQLKETNPMLGHRGCRLAITYPEIYKMQTKAIFLAAIEIRLKQRKNVKPEIMIPFVCIVEELSFLRQIIDEVAKNIFQKHKITIPYQVGTMIELPRAALCADQLAKYADFLSFGTNDLTQTTFGISRDDAGGFLEYYQKNNFLKQDPFVKIDLDGVGELIKIACKKSKQQNRNIKLGICGEHGGDPESIEFCLRNNLDYVSCSPFRIPIAKIAAAQAQIKKNIYENNK